jgi:hypothetical protein
VSLQSCPPSLWQDMAWAWLLYGHPGQLGLAPWLRWPGQRFARRSMGPANSACLPHPRPDCRGRRVTARPVTLIGQGQTAWVLVRGVMMVRLTRGARAGLSVRRRRPYPGCQIRRVSARARHIILGAFIAFFQSILTVPPWVGRPVLAIGGAPTSQARCPCEGSGG